MLTITSIFLRSVSANFASGLESDIIALSWRAIVVGGITLVILVLLSAWLKDKYPILSKPLFVMIVLSIVLPTFTLLGSTVYLNMYSYVGGPVHWHADIEMWACNNELELRDPIGRFNNKIGTSVLHEHNDKRIHLEGVPITEKDASLSKFMHVIGGGISNESLTIPVNSDDWFENELDGDGSFGRYNNLIIKSNFINNGADGQFAKFNNDDPCDKQRSEVQVFVYKTISDNQYEQKKVKDPASLVISPQPNVPPGDCIIIEFGKPRDYTDKLCEQFGIRDKDRCEEFGVKPAEREICTLTDVTPYEFVPRAVDYQPKRNSKGIIYESCEVYFDEDGNYRAIEIGSFKPDGTYLDPEKDCDAYAAKLRSGLGE